MNYRHAFHAGSFADVVKHAVLARIVAHLREKPAPFRIIDTHAGAGLYDLTGPEASKTREWENGIARLMGAALSEESRALLKPYLDVVGDLNPSLVLTRYPGSPALVQAWLRPDDRLVACEREPGAARALAALMRRDRRVKAVEIDGWTALNAYVPPRERRGAVLIDPPFEERGEFDRLQTALAGAYRKWATGLYALWFPIKDPRETNAFAKSLVALGIPRMLLVELMVRRAADAARLNGAGLVVVNPPWRLESELGRLLPELGAILGGASATHRLVWLAAEPA